VAGGPWTRWDVLSDPLHMLAKRSDERTLELISPADATLSPVGGFSLFRGAGAPIRVGEEHRGAGFTLRVRSVSELGPTRASVSFDAPVTDDRLWVSRKHERLWETKPPEVGFGLPSDR
jgi:hypothetical protein